MKLLRSVIALMASSALLHAAEYHVSQTGTDDGPGTADRPFRSIQKAATAMKAGDTCWIHKGVYRETVRPAASGRDGQPLRFRAVAGEKVVVSGADTLDAQWHTHKGRIYKATTDLAFEQLFVDGRMMFEARWPNSSVDDIMAMKRASAGEGTGYEQLAEPNLPPGDWNGAWILTWPGARWTNATRRIEGYRPGKGFRFDRTFESKKKDEFHKDDPFLPRAGNPYILFGSLAGLDAPGEWFLDRKTRTLYLWAPDGKSPRSHRVEVKQRDVAFDLKGLSHVELHGLDVFGAAIDMTGAKHCLVDECRLEYVDHFRETDRYKKPAPKNVVTGEHNTWRRCRIAYSAGVALKIGGRHNRLVNSIVHDVNYTGANAPGVELNDSEGTVVSRCTMFRSGRALINHYRAKGIRIEHCDLHHANLLTSDTGGTYCWGTDGAGSVIAYNWVHDNMGGYTVGIYLDNFSSNFIVHHNVIWNISGTGIRLNSDALNHLVCNNTIASTPSPFGVYTYYNRVPTMKGTRIINNLVLGRLKTNDPGTFVQGKLGPTLRANGSGAVGTDGVPTAGSAAVDAGAPVAGITDGFVGKAPDLGAYERGGKRWRPGADWGGVESKLDIAFEPQAAVTEATMIKQGLVLWLDASHRASVKTDARGRLVAWRDRSGKGHHPKVGNGFTLVPKGLNGRPVVRGSGRSNLAVGTLRKRPGPVTLFIVSQNLQAGGQGWQRIAGAYSGKGQEWVTPNWTILRPNAKDPEPYGPQVFYKQAMGGLVLDRMTLFGAPSKATQFLVGDVAEVLVYDRVLRFDETSAIEAYIEKKWGVK